MLVAPANATVDRGQTVVFHCLAFSYGKLQYKWLPEISEIRFKITTTLLHRNTVHTLLIKRVQETDAREYCCEIFSSCAPMKRCAWLTVSP